MQSDGLLAIARVAGYVRPSLLDMALRSCDGGERTRIPGMYCERQCAAQWFSACGNFTQSLQFLESLITLESLQP